jgi:hypothetical protein
MPGLLTALAVAGHRGSFTGGAAASRASWRAPLTRSQFLAGYD